MAGQKPLLLHKCSPPNADRETMGLKKNDDDHDNNRQMHPVGSAYRPASRLARDLALALSALLLALMLLIRAGPIEQSAVDSEMQLNEALASLASSLNNNDASRLPSPPLQPSKASLRRKRALSDAINAMRCMLLPSCYPDVPCGDNHPPMKLPQGKQWEQHSFCTGDLASASQVAKSKNQKCLVYSFGVHDSTQWEERMAKEFECDVYAFDPTSKFEEKEIAPNVWFHKLGLQGSDVDVSQTHSALYDAIDPAKLRTLGDIRKLLGHEERQVDVLRLDCEGCEWGVLKQLACSNDSEMVDQLMVEMHFQKNLGIATDDDLLIAADAITCLEEKRWGLVSQKFSGCDPIDAEYLSHMHKIIKQDTLYMLMYSTFRRMPVEARLYKYNDPDYSSKFTTMEVYTMKDP